MMKIKQPIPLNVDVIPLANLERVGSLFLPIKLVSDGKNVPCKTLVLYCVVVLRQHHLPETVVERVFVLLETDC